MRQKDTYTFEEYNRLRQEIINLKVQLGLTKKELEDTKFINNILVQYERGKSYDNIRRIIEEEEEKRRIKGKVAKYPYYIEIKEYVEMGITDINKIAQLVGKSYSTVWRALHDMNMYPIQKKGRNNMRLNI